MLAVPHAERVLGELVAGLGAVLREEADPHRRRLGRPDGEVGGVLRPGGAEPLVGAGPDRRCLVAVLPSPAVRAHVDHSSPVPVSHVVLAFGGSAGQDARVTGATPRRRPDQGGDTRAQDPARHRRSRRRHHRGRADRRTHSCRRARRPRSSTGLAAVFMVNPVQSSGDQDLSDQKDSATAVPASEYATVTLRNLDGSGYLSGDWANVRSTTGTQAHSDTNDVHLRPQPGRVRAGDGLLLDQPGPGVPPVARVRVEPAAHPEAPVRRADQPERASTTPTCGTRRT